MSFKSVSKELQSILSDNISGSRELLDKLFVYLQNHREYINQELISLLQKHFSDFQTIQNFLLQLTTAIEKNSVSQYLENFNQSNIFKKIYANFKPEIENFNSFATISNSKTILEVLKLVAKEKESLQVFVSEGRPILEGRILAEELASENILTSLITESQIYDTVKIADCGIIGADKIFANGNVVNKVGSNLIALACKEFNKTV